MTDFVWQNFSVLEWLLCIEVVVLLTAAFFYQVAKVIARSDRQDPLVRFYRVFWRSFFTGVTPMSELDHMQAEMSARAAGFVGVGDLDSSQLSSLDAPDLDLGDLASLAAPADETAGATPRASVRPIGRRGSEDDERLARIDEVVRGKKPSESREERLIRESREAREKGESRSKPPAVEAHDSYVDDDAPIKPVREREAPAAPRTQQSVDAERSVKSKFGVRIVPFCNKDEIKGREHGEIVINVIYAPEDGHANGVIINLIAERIGVRPYQIVLLGGHYKVRKTLQVAGLDQATLDARLAQI
jgi:uncharacterized protein YggU (UPF0235/DUF167 family)